MGHLTLVVALVFSILLSPRTLADAGWFESGDTALRLDLQLLNDAGVIKLPINHWPLPRAAVREALRVSRQHLALNTAVEAALHRVSLRVDSRSGLAAQAWFTAGSAGTWRDFDTAAREDAELSGQIEYDNSRISIGITGTATANPPDGQTVRADGSHATVQLGNWLLSANTLERWWGPAHEGSLILSNNARPMPTMMLERAAAIPFESRWLRWLGPWRFSFGISRMEGSRDDIDAPLFMAWRVSIMPTSDVEIGFSRTAQFCGDQLRCDWNTFGNLLAGNDNVGIDATPENEPGNQMAGFDLRWNSPFGNWPVAIYSQYIGEDESSYLPAKFLSQIGVEAWKPLSDGAILQGFAEYTSTTCSANSGSGPYYNCAYNQGRFDVEGYRYRGRVIGFTTDRDAESYSIGGIYSASNGGIWTATARRSRLNRDNFGDVLNSVSSVPADYHALELGWKGELFGGKAWVDLGVQATHPEGADRDTEPFGFIGWRHDFSL